MKTYVNTNICKQIFYFFFVTAKTRKQTKHLLSHGGIQELCYINLNTLQQQKWNKLLIPPLTWTNFKSLMLSEISKTQNIILWLYLYDFILKSQIYSLSRMFAIWHWGSCRGKRELIWEIASLYTFFFLCPNLWHIEVPGPVIESKLLQPQIL